MSTPKKNWSRLAGAPPQCQGCMWLTKTACTSGAGLLGCYSYTGAMDPMTKRAITPAAKKDLWGEEREAKEIMGPNAPPQYRKAVLISEAVRHVEDLLERMT